MLKFALCGGYVNFGIFRFYGDVCLDDALNTFVKMLLSIPQSDLLVSLFVCLIILFLCLIKTIKNAFHLYLEHVILRISNSEHTFKFSFFVF